jgi:signal transduction histidine kinase
MEVVQTAPSATDVVGGSGMTRRRGNLARMSSHGTKRREAAVRSAVRRSIDALDAVVRGLATSVLAAFTVIALMLTVVTSLVGIGLLLRAPVLQMTREVADRERARLDIPPHRLSTTRAEAEKTRRELAWVFVHGTAGLLIGLIGLTIPLGVLQHLTYPLWVGVTGPSAAPTIVFWNADGPLGVLVVTALAALWMLVFVIAEPVIARIQAAPGRTLLTPRHPDLSERVAELTATRAAAVDAHAEELRRLERALHDGAQNRIVAATVLIGAARRAAGDDERLIDLLDRAQLAGETALAELRSIVRGMLPPILSARGVEGALSSLIATTPLRCDLSVDLPHRPATSIETTVYFVVAECLTNAVRHSTATRVRIDVAAADGRLVVRVEDDGRGGADEADGSGLRGMRTRVEAVDGTFRISSPRGGPTVVEAVMPCAS